MVAEKDGPAGWTVAAGVLTVAPGAGGIRTKRGFADCQLVNGGCEATVRAGRILLQSEGSEVFYRNVVLTRY